MEADKKWVIHYQYYRTSQGIHTPHVFGDVMKSGEDNKDFASAEEAILYLNKNAGSSFFQTYSFRNANVQNGEFFYRINGAQPPFTLGPKCRQTSEGPIPIEDGSKAKGISPQLN